MNTVIIFVIFLVIMLGTTAVYFYLFSAKNERFLLYWGFSWLAYSVALICIILSSDANTVSYYAGRGIFDMLNILFLLCSVYAFVRIEIPGYFLRFTLYLSIWFAIGIYYNFNMLSVFLPIAIFEVFCTFMICRMIYKYWSVGRIEKLFSLILFSLWGCSIAALSVFDLDFGFLTGTWGRFAEILFSNMLNYSIVIIYLHRSVERQTQTEKHFRVIAENASDIIFFYSLFPAPSFTYVTPSAELITGYPVSEFYSDPKFYLKLVPAEEFAEISSIFDPAQDTSAGKQSHIFRFLHRNGSQLWAEMNSSVLYEDNQPVAVEGIIRDISLMKTTEEELVSSKEARDRLLSYISHELRLPLSSIIGYAEAMKNGTVSEEDREDAVEIIHNKAQTLSRLIDDLFQLSKLETGQFSFNFMLSDVRELSAHLVGTHRKDVAESGLQLVTKIGRVSMSGIVIVDRERIDQVLSNLIANAIKFSAKDGSVTLTIEVDTVRRLYVVSVADTGVGIAEKDLPRVFERFFTRPSRFGASYAGSGLGLTLCKEIIEAHKGSMTVQSRESAGSIFTFSIPLYDESLDELPAHGKVW